MDKIWTLDHAIGDAVTALTGETRVYFFPFQVTWHHLVYFRTEVLKLAPEANFLAKNLGKSIDFTRLPRNTAA